MIRRSKCMLGATDRGATGRAVRRAKTIANRRLYTCGDNASKPRSGVHANDVLHAYMHATPRLVGAADFL
jgi:hypothetical protein